MSAARVVFSRDGYQGSSVEDILREADIARATFYKYFPNKRRVFFELMNDLLKTLFNTTRDFMLRDVDTPGVLVDRMRQSLTLFYRLILENRGLLSSYFREAFMSDPGLYAVWDDFERRMTVLFSDMIRRGIEGGAFRQMDETLVAGAVLMVFLQVPYRNILTGIKSDIDVDYIAGEMARFAVWGLLPGGSGPTGKAY